MTGISDGISAAGDAAAEAGFYEEAADAAEMTLELLGGIGANGGEGAFAPRELLIYVVELLLNSIRENAGAVLSLLTVSVATVFLAALAKQDGLLCKSAGRAGLAAATALPACAVFAAAFGSAKAAMSALEAVGLAVVPAVAAAGKGAGAYGFVACAQAASALLRYAFLPLVAIYAALSYASVLDSERFTAGLLASVKKLFTWGLGVVMTIFSFCSVSSGLAASAANSLGARAVKYAGSMVPVVGGYLTEAADTVIASATLIKTAGGVCAVLVIVMVCLSPFVKLLAYYCCINFLGIGTGIFGGSSPAGDSAKEVLRITGELLSMTMGLVAMMAAFFIINIAVIAR